MASPILTSITFWKQAFKTAALFVQSSLFENLLLKKFSRVIVVYCSIIKVLFAVLFKRQLLYFIKSFCLCQELFYFSLSLFSSFPLLSRATAYLWYHFQNSLSTTFLIYFSIISLIFKSSSFLPIKNVPPPRLLLSSVPLLFSLLFLSDECYLITAVFNCQCFLYISCNSEYSEKLASAFPNTNSYCKLACSKLIGLGNIGRMPLTERTSVL